MEQLRLRPFRPATDDARLSGSGLPLGVLARVQLYTTDALGRFEGKAHSPGCQHQGRDRGLGLHYDLVTVAQMLHAERFEPCSRCGGYATRRLSAPQVAYYRAAHQVHDLARQARRALNHPDLKADTASLLASLKKWDGVPPAGDWFAEEDEDRQWRRFIHQLLRRLETGVADHRRQL
ncbi:hypothetical protein [Streptomyces sp. NPDC056672]|uniref:hypothetical protein n=1 Tax=Streptomyces sp. NPDC056672 TaxID=3345906 RepID=UPI003685EE27